ncbi:MAG: AsmA family protein [Ferruginibacter sp.]|nr:AsmA family protein [Ferruginibacter sp.]
MKKFRKYLLRSLAVLLGLVLLAMIIIFSYVSVNKQKIIKQVTSELSKKINGNASIGNVELSFFRHFPKISVLLHNVKITDTMYAQHRHPFFEASEVFVQLSIQKLFKKESPLNGLRINDASLYIYTDTSGYSNDYLFKQKKSAPEKINQSESKNELQFVELNNLRIIVNDQKREKLHDLVVKNMDLDLNDKDIKTILFSVDADILVHSLAFNLPRGSFLKEKRFQADFKMRYDKLLQQLQFDSIDVRLEGHPFNLSGKFDLSGSTPQFGLNIHTKNILYSNARSFLPERISKSLSIVTIDNPLDADAFINGPLKGGDPSIYIKWSSKEVHLSTPFLDFDEAKFTGFFTNEAVPGQPRKDPNSKIVINNFNALWNDLPVQAHNIEILDLSTPTLTCDLTSAFPLATLNEILGTNSLQLTSGDAEVNMTYKGPLEKNDNSNSFLNGTIKFKNGTVLYTSRNVEMKKVNATMIFKNSDVFIENFQTVVFNNTFTMQGVAKNLLTLINTGPNNINIDWNIYAPSLDLDKFIYLLAARKKATVQRSKKVKIANMASKIDGILDQGRLQVQLKSDRLTFRKFQAENVQANISLLTDSYILNNVSMNHAGGRMSMNGSLVPAQHNNLVKLNMDVMDVDVSRLFKAFENFGQDGITDKSLEGKLTAKVKATLGLNESGKVNPSSLASTVDFSLKNGALNNYEPVKKMQRYVFKKRDFDNIRFAELKNRFDIKDQEVTINRMEIQSSVFSMFVEGLYSMKGNTDISIQVPLNNLKKRDSTYNPENIGTITKAGKSIFLRGRTGADGSIKFNIDLFNKYNKTKKDK